MATFFRFFASGRSPPSLRNSTMERCAARRASWRCSGCARTCPSFDSSVYGCSKSPMRTFMARMGRTAASMSANFRVPSSTRPARCCENVPLAMSMFIPARNARKAASRPSRAKPSITRFPTAIASLTTKPWKPHSPRSTSCNRKRFPLAGTSLRSM